MGCFIMWDGRFMPQFDRKPCLLAPKWDTLMKHEDKRKAKKDLPKLNVKKGELYNSLSCKHKHNQALFFTKSTY
jgi:hypothetical protein